MKSLDGTVTKFSSGAPHTTTVSDALFALLTAVADEASDQLEEILPKAIGYFLKHLKTVNPKSNFWKEENFTHAVSRFAQTIS